MLIGTVRGSKGYGVKEEEKERQEEGHLRNEGTVRKDRNIWSACGNGQ